MKKNEDEFVAGLPVHKKMMLSMRFTLFFMLLSLLSSHAATYAQKTKLDLSFKDSHIREILSRIEDQSEFTFMYDNSKIDVEQRVSIDVKSATITETLDKIFQDAGVFYKVMGRHIMLYAGPETVNTNQQKNGRVSGKVTDSTGAPLPGVTVVIKSTNTGTITNTEGQFNLPDVPANAILQFSFVGMKMQEIPVAGKTTLNVSMAEESIGIEEVVAVGYGTIKKSDLTGAIASVTSDDLLRGGKNNPLEAMQGSVSGVNIIRSNNKPGGGMSIDIRGLSSISKSNTPLIVIDGIPGADLTVINPEDIEKIDILKDASATAIYGSRGANGVIIVTTKRGTLGKPVISYNGYYGLKSATNMPEFMSGDEWVQLVRESYRAKNNNVYVEDEKIFTDPSELKAVQDHNYFDWIDALKRTGVQTSHTISATGGTDHSKYAVSGGYYSEEGLIAPEKYTRYSLKANIDLEANDYIGFGASMYMVYSLQNQGNNDLFQDIHRARQTQHPYSLVTGELIKKFSSNGIFNPLVTQPNSVEKYKNTNILGNVYLEIKPVKGLNLKSTFSPYITYQTYGRFRDTWSKALQGTALPTALMRSGANYNWVWDNIASYKLEQGDHKLDFTGVFTMQEYQNEQIQGDVKDLGFKSLWYNLGGGTVNSLTSNYSKNSMVSYLGRINYSFKDRYLITASGRYDGSSKLSEGHKWAFFPSAAVAWRVSEESFMKSIPTISSLKLRLSYGETGNDSVDPYSTSANISSTTYYMFGSTVANGNTPGSLGNSALSWEQTEEINAGLDLGLFNNRFSASLEYYNRLTTDLIMNKLIATHTGYSSVAANVGSSRNKGVEITLNTENVKSNAFRWTTNLTLAYNKNLIVDLAYKEDLGKYSKQLEGMEGDYTNKWFIGQPIRINWIYETIGVWQLDEAEEAAKYGQKPGQWRVRDFDGDGAIHSDKDKTIFGKKSPDWIGGMTNTFEYTNFDLSVHMYWRTGLTNVNQFQIYYTGEANQHNFKNAKHDYWTPENPTNKGAQPSNQGPYRNAASNVYVKSDFLKISDITLGYTFSKNLIERYKISGLRIYSTIQNPFTFTKFNGFDPEQPESTIANNSWISRNLLLGVNISF